MGYRAIEGEAFRTRYEGAPEVRWISVEDAHLAVEVAFQVVSTPRGSEATFTTIRFDSVFEFRWIESEVTYFPSNPDDFEFGLIEIVDSDLIELLVRSGMHASQPVGQRLGGVLDERHLRHFRIGFDDYGTFDVVCLEVLWDQHTKPSPDRSNIEPFDGQPI